MVMNFDEAYWQERYLNNSTGWDIGYVSTPLKSYFDQLEDKDIRILIPGAGNAYEAGYLWDLGFKQVDVLDIATAPLEAFKNQLPNFPEEQLIQRDFFNHQADYDLIVEQTFFCALDPQLRSNYVRKTSELLKPGGKLVGLLWNKSMNTVRPPFGGSEEEYRRLFSPFFDLEIMSTAYNSIPPRAGAETFIKFRKV